MAFKVKLDKVNEAVAAAEAKNKKGNDGPSIKWFKFDSSKATLRLMPAWTDEGPFAFQFWRIVHQHWNVTDTLKAPILCPKKTPHLGGECPICDFVDSLRADKENLEAQELVKAIRDKPSYLFTVVDIDDPEYTAKDVSEWKKNFPDKKPPFSVGDAKLQVYAAPFTVYNKIIRLYQEGFDLTDFETGHNITVEKSGKGEFTKYEVSPKPKATAISIPEDHPLIDLAKAGMVLQETKMKELLATGIAAEFDALPAPKAKPALKADTRLADAKKNASKAVKDALNDDQDDEDEPLAYGSDEESDDLESEMLAGLED